MKLKKEPYEYSDKELKELLECKENKIIEKIKEEIKFRLQMYL